MEPYFLSLVQLSWQPHTPPNTCPCTGPTHLPSLERRDSVRMEWGTQSGKGTEARGAEGRSVSPQAHPWGLETRGSQIHAASVTNPSLATGASRRAPRGRGPGSFGPPRPSAAGRG